MYRTLKDAYEVTNDPRFLSGKTQIWYYKRSESRDFGMGSFGLERSGKWPFVENLSLTHVFIGFVDESNPSKVFQMMQSEYWSPNGEASTLPELRMAGHTSMSVGDIIVFPGSKALMVDMAGFYDLADAPVSLRMASMRGIEARTTLEMKMKDGSVIPAGSVVRVSFREDKPEIAMVEFMYSTYKIKTINLFKYIGRPFTKVPGSAALERMVDEGVAKTVTGKRAEPDGFGDDDSPSWLLVLGYI
jgi:hypothetical protein